MEEIIAMLGSIEIGSLVEGISDLFAQPSFFDNVATALKEIGTVDFTAFAGVIEKMQSIFSIFG